MNRKTLPAPIRVRGWRLAALIWSILLFGTLSVLTFSAQISKLLGDEPGYAGSVEGGEGDRGAPR